MDIAVHWGVLRSLRKDVDANGIILLTTATLDLVVLGAFLILKGTSDPIILLVAGFGLLTTFLGERFFLKNQQIVQQ